MRKPEGGIEEMEREIQPVINDYPGNYISKINIEYQILENPSDFVKSMSRQRRRLLITLAMFQLGWKPWNGNPNKEVRSFVRE